MKDMLGWNRISNVRGTRKLVPRNQLVVSVGQPALDIMLEGGLPVGSIFLIEDDEFGECTNYIVKNYLAEGVMNEHELLIASLDYRERDIVMSLPDPLVIPIDKIPRQRYYQPRKSKPLRKLFEESESAPTDTPIDPPAFGNTFGLSTHRDSMFRLRRKSKIDEWCIPEEELGVNTYENLYEYIKKSLDQKYSFNLPSQERNVLRIAIVSIGTGSWTGDILKFFIKLRLLLRNFLTTCLISIQPRIFDKKDMSRIEYFCDTVIQLQTFYEGDEEDETSEYQGSVILKKLSSVNNWNSVMKKTNEDWVFKVRKGSRFIVEKVSEPASKRARREDDGRY